MNTKPYLDLLELMKVEKVNILSKLILKLKEKPYIIFFAAPGLSPEVVISETFIDLLTTSLEIGNTDLLIHQYKWTVTMLEPRGMKPADFVKGFCDIILTTRSIVENYLDPAQQILSSEFFTKLEDEFVSEIK